jgi:hypothetical protein
LIRTNAVLDQAEFGLVSAGLKGSLRDLLALKKLTHGEFK